MQLHNPLNPTTGVEDPTQLPWSNGVPQTGQPGSYPPYQAVVEPMEELVNLIGLSGQTPSDSDLNQVTRAVRGGQLDFDATDTGSADAVLCQIGLAHTAIAAGLPFTFIKGPAANTGNAVPTLTITDLQGNSGLTGTIVKSGGGALAKGDLPAAALITVRARAPGVFAVVSLLTISDISPLILANGIVGRTAIFTSSGTFQVPNNVTAVEVEVIGAGGAAGASGDGTGGTNGGNSGGGGSGGGYAYKRIIGIASGTNVPVTVGAAGVGAASSNGTTGGASSFGSYASATGGGRGYFGIYTKQISDPAGAGTGDLTISGQTGGATGPNDTSPTISDILTIYGRGGFSPRGFGTTPYGGTGANGSGYGSGGTGASGGSGIAGGNGAPGLIIVRW